MLPPKKYFGQNFLRDTDILSKIIHFINPQPEQHILEIGPGHGELTILLIDKIKKMDAVEIDRDLIANLNNLAQQKNNLFIHHADMLKFDFASLGIKEKSLRVIGNLPYNISSPLLFYLLKHKNNIQDIHVMLQEEVVNRIIATPGGHDYGRLSIMLQYHCQVDKLLHIPPSAFYPPPQVNSAIVRLIPYEKLPYVAQNENLFSQIVQAAFSQRRKMLRNTLKSYVTNDDLLSLLISPLSRAEELSIQKYVSISNLVLKKRLYNGSNG